MENSDSDETYQVPEFEPSPESISFLFEKNAKSREEGVLFTHNRNFKWYHQQQHTTEDGYNIR